MDFKDVLRSRRSVRRFSEKKVSPRLVEEIIEDATYAPTPCNQQLWQFVAVTDDRIKTQLITEAFSSTLIRHAPVVLVVCYDAWHITEAVQASSMATQNILLSATEKGVGSLSMNSYGDEKTIKKILNLPETYTINCFVLFGYPTELYKTVPTVSRRPVKEVLSFNKFDSEHLPNRTSYNTYRWTKEQLVDYQKYYCRKTFLGKTMDIMDDSERLLVKTVLETEDAKNIIDFFSYDGTFLELFPNSKISSVNLDKETEQYVKEATKIYCPKKEKDLSYSLYNSIKGKFELATMLFKVERLPKTLRQDSFYKIASVLDKNGELVIVSRLPNFVFSSFYFFIRTIFGDDIRKTGIYAFWGPYRPLKETVIVSELKRRGFRITSSRKYFAIPPFFNQFLQMFLQYMKSGRSSYLHRTKHNNVFTKLLSQIIGKTQKESCIGSVLVLRAKKIA